MILKIHTIQFGVIVNLIQMKLMKVVYTDEKQDEPRISKLLEIIIDLSDDPENASEENGRVDHFSRGKGNLCSQTIAPDFQRSFVGISAVGGSSPWRGRLSREIGGSHLD
jgi:hypothetical protein